MFEIGDVVVLVSGGPLMTVTAVGDGPRQETSVIWFDGGYLREARIVSTALRLSERPLRDTPTTEEPAPVPVTDIVKNSIIEVTA